MDKSYIIKTPEYGHLSVIWTVQLIKGRLKDIKDITRPLQEPALNWKNRGPTVTGTST